MKMKQGKKLLICQSFIMLSFKESLSESLYNSKFSLRNVISLFFDTHKIEYFIGSAIMIINNKPIIMFHNKMKMWGYIPIIGLMIMVLFIIKLVSQDCRALEFLQQFFFTAPLSFPARVRGEKKNYGLGLLFSLAL